jgi:hypothetical protein
MVLVGAGIAFATFSSSGRQVALRHAGAQGALGQTSEDEGVHGGTIERFHAGCDVPDGAKLSGNWTHGDYVTAWAATGDNAKIQEAAHSRCGKPAHAGQGKPAHAGQGKPAHAGQGKPAKEVKPRKGAGPRSKVSPSEPQPPTHA